MAKFTSISGPTTGFYKEKGSKFFAYAYPVQNIDDINIHLQELQKEHSKAKHHCYAYRLGADKSLFKANDAGEPANSAGMPILNQIRSAELTNIIIVVIRYFGGTKLGISGLIHAYKTAAAISLENAILAEDFEKEELTLSTTYHKLSELQNFLKKRNVTIVSQEFGENCIVKASIATENASSLKNDLAEMPYIQVIK